LSAVVDYDVGGGVGVAANDVIKCVAIFGTGAALVHVSPVHTNTPFSTSLLVAAAMSSVFDDNDDGGVDVGVNAVITCVAIVVTGAALVHVFPVAANVPSTESVSLAAAATSVVHDDVGGGVIVGAYESPVATNTRLGAYSSLAAAVSSVVHDDVGGGVLVGVYAVTECVGTGVTGVARVNESPVGADMPFDASRSLAAAALSAIVDDDVVGGAVAKDAIKATNTSFSVSLSFAAA